MQGHSVLPDIWFLILGLVLYLYLFTDGFDLGVGILCLLDPDEERRGVMMETIESVWHANQTWLVILGGLLFGAFPVVYGSVLPALYVPAGLLLFALMARGVGLDYWYEASYKPTWSRLFGWGSLAVILCHGFLLGGLLQGIRLEGWHFVGGVFDWLTPFTGLVCLALICVYTMLGAAWLIWRTTGEVQYRARLWGLRAGAGTVVCLALLAALVGLTDSLAHLAGRAGQGGLSPLFLVSFLAAVINVALYFRALGKGWERRPLMYAGAMLVWLFLAFGGCLYPVIVPPSLTLAEAAAPPAMLRIMLVTIGLFLPVPLYYNAYQYRVSYRKTAAPAAPDDEAR